LETEIDLEEAARGELKKRRWSSSNEVRFGLRGRGLRKILKGNRRTKLSF